MFIYQFNRLIRNRWLWGFFAFVIAFAFVGVPLIAQMDSQGRGGGEAGRLGGERISQEDFTQTQFFLHALDQDDVEREIEERDRMTWERIAALHAAEHLGLAAQDDEVGRAIRNDPAFQTNGRFDPQRYRFLLAQHMGLEPQVYEAYAAHQISMMKLSDLLSAAVWVAPSEMRVQIAHLTDEFTVQFVKVDAAPQDVEIEIGDDTLLQHYETHGEAFRLPEQVQVSYLTIGATNFLDAVEIDPEAVQAFYQDHPERFAQPEATNTVDALMPFEAVEAQIIEELTHTEALKLARSAAEAVADQLFLAPSEDALEVIAVQRRFPLSTSSWFHARQSLPEITAGRAFVDVAFELEPQPPERRFSDVVAGHDEFYVMGALGRNPSQIPPLEEIRPLVRKAAEEAERGRQFREHLDALRERLLAGLAKSADFETVASAAGYAPSSNLVFSVMQTFRGDTDLPYADALSRAVTRLSTGELSEPEFVRDGALLVMAHDRTPGDPLTAEMLRDEVRMRQEQSRGPAVVGDWMTWNLERLDLKRAAF